MSKSPSKEAPKTSGHKSAGEAAAASWPGMLAQWNAEMAAHYGRRMQEWWLLPVKAMQCTSAEQLKELQGEFADSLMTDYRHAAQKLAQAFGETTANVTKDYAATLLKAQDDAKTLLDQARAQAEQIVADARARTSPPPSDEKVTRAA